MQGFKTRVKIWHKKHKSMMPSAPLWKCDFFTVDTSEMVLIFSIGIKDSEGKEIYEGDIIHRINKSPCCGKIKYEETQIVRWEGTGFYGFPLPDSPLGSCGFAGIDSEDVSIIGNIHENPELTTDI